MTHTITPPPELVKELQDLGNLDSIALAYQAGADHELEACVKWIEDCGYHPSVSEDFRAARRPKPQTLNSVALQMLGTIERDAHYIPEITDTIRRALEALDD